MTCAYLFAPRQQDAGLRPDSARIPTPRFRRPPLPEDPRVDGAREEHLVPQLRLQPGQAALVAGTLHQAVDVGDVEEEVLVIQGVPPNLKALGALR